MLQEDMLAPSEAENQLSSISTFHWLSIVMTLIKSQYIQALVHLRVSNSQHVKVLRITIRNIVKEVAYLLYCLIPAGLPNHDEVGSSSKA